MSNNEIIKAWKEADDKASDPAGAPENPAGDVSLSDEDLGAVAGGTLITFDCTGQASYCHGTCNLTPASTMGCCN